MQRSFKAQVSYRQSDRIMPSFASSHDSVFWPNRDMNRAGSRHRLLAREKSSLPARPTLVRAWTRVERLGVACAVWVTVNVDAGAGAGAWSRVRPASEVEIFSKGCAHDAICRHQLPDT